MNLELPPNHNSTIRKRKIVSAHNSALASIENKVYKDLPYFSTEAQQKDDLEELFTNTSALLNHEEIRKAARTTNRRNARKQLLSQQASRRAT